jgi:hypothetical protein
MKLPGISIVLAAAFAAITPAAARAGTIFLSGDCNVANPLTGSFGAGISAGNQRFFQNVLQGGTRVCVLESVSVGSVDLSDTDINSFYNTLPGVSSVLVSGTLTSGILAGVNLFVSPVPDHSFTGPELTLLGSFLSGGGSIFFLGENNSSDFTSANTVINSALAALGSPLSIVPDLFDSGFHGATGTQIATDPFTIGVTSFTYAAPSRVSGGTTLFYGSGQQPFLAYQIVPEPGSCVLLILGSALLLRVRARKIASALPALRF